MKVTKGPNCEGSIYLNNPALKASFYMSVLRYFFHVFTAFYKTIGKKILCLLISAKASSQHWFKISKKNIKTFSNELNLCIVGHNILELADFLVYFSFTTNETELDNQYKKNFVYNCLTSYQTAKHIESQEIRKHYGNLKISWRRSLVGSLPF